MLTCGTGSTGLGVSTIRVDWVAWVGLFSWTTWVGWVGLFGWTTWVGWVTWVGLFGWTTWVGWLLMLEEVAG